MGRMPMLQLGQPGCQSCQIIFLCMPLMLLAVWLWAEEVLDGIGVAQGNMIGISPGGWLVLKLASVAADRIGSAVLMSSAGFVSINIKLVLQILFKNLSRNPRTIATNLVKLLSGPDLPVDPFYVDFFESILCTKYKSETLTPKLHDLEIQKLQAPTYLLMEEFERSFNPYIGLKRGVNLLPTWWLKKLCQVLVIQCSIKIQFG
jgi:hypothetical protein